MKRTSVFLALAAWFLVTGNGPPYSGYFDQYINGLDLTERFEQEERRLFALCHTDPFKITQGAPDMEPMAGTTRAEWQEMRCLEIWLVHLLAILNDRHVGELAEGVIAGFREDWLIYWRDYYSESAYGYVIPHGPDDLAMPRYLRLLKEWIHEAYLQRIEGRY